MGTPHKVAHTKFAVAETCITSVKLITVIVCLQPLLTMYFFVLSSRSRAHANQMLEGDDTVPVQATRCFCEY